MRKATHQTLSLLLPLSPLETPPALGAGGMSVPCRFAVELSTAAVLSVFCKEVLTTTTLDASKDDGGADGVGLCDADRMDRTEEVMEATEATILEVSGTAEERAVTSVVGVEVAVREAEGAFSELDGGKTSDREIKAVRLVDTADTTEYAGYETLPFIPVDRIEAKVGTTKAGVETERPTVLIGEGTGTTTVIEVGIIELGRL